MNWLFQMVCSSQCYSESCSIFFLKIFSLSPLWRLCSYYIVLIYSIPPSTCLSSRIVLKFLSPLSQLFDFQGVIVVELFRGLFHINAARKAAVMHLMRWQQLFPQIFLRSYLLSCSLEAYLHRWNFLEGCISQGEVDLTDICQVRGVQPSQTIIFQHLATLPLTMGSFPMLSPPRTRYCQ